MLRFPSRLILLAGIFAGLATSLLADVQGPSAEQLKSYIDIRQQRVDLLRGEIKEADGQIESRVDLLIDTLNSITDSKDSRTKVARMKEDTMKRLAKTIQLYDQKRAVFRQELRNPETVLSADEKKKVIAAFDALIEKRTRQMLSLSRSMPEHKDYERYRVSGDTWAGNEYQRNKDFEQNRRMTAHTNSQRDALVKQLNASIARLERLGKALQQQLAATTDPAVRKDRQAEIATNEKLLAERRQQKLDLLKATESANREVSLKEAVDLDQSIKKVADELRRDLTRFFERYQTFITEMTALRATEQTLAARQAQ